MTAPYDWVEGILLTPDVCAALEDAGLHDLRIRVKGQDERVDRVLHGIRVVAMASRAYVDESRQRKPTKAPEESKQWMTPTEAASVLGITPTRVRQLASDGRYPGAELSEGRWAIPTEAIEISKRGRQRR